MEFFRDTNIQFMKYRKYWVAVSAVLLTVSLVTVLVQGKLNLGIDFAGGTQLTLKFRDQPEVDRLRDLMESVGIGEAPAAVHIPAALPPGLGVPIYVSGIVINPMVPGGVSTVGNTHWFVLN